MTLPVTGDALAAYRGRVADRAAGRAALGAPSCIDELVSADGLRGEQELIAEAVETMGLSGLRVAAAEARRLVQDDAIRYGSDIGDGTVTPIAGRNWVIDPLPIVVGAMEWDELRAALQQRAVLLDLILTDLYGERSLLRQGLIPPEIVFGHSGFVHQVDGIALPGERQLLISATDLARGADGQWFAISDRSAIPSGAGYTMATRRITSQVMAGLHRRARLARMRGYFHTMSAALLDVARSEDELPKGVVLSPGSASETGFEHGFIATLLGFALVEAEDLAVRDGRVWITSGERQAPVDVMLRRVDAAYTDPLELRPDSRLGVAGLIEATRRGALSVVNPIGAGVLENPALLALLPELSQALLGEDLALPSATTWWCGHATGRSHVLANLDRLVIKPISRSFDNPTLCGWELAADERQSLAARIQAQPWAWCAQEPLPGSTAPVVTPSGLEPRRFVLRSFGVHRDGEYHFLPGGLGRVAPSPEDFLISNMAGALAKDVWVLAPEENAPSAWSYERTSDLRRMPIGTRPAVLAPRVADDLFWVGRYTERAEGTARLLRVADDLVEDYANRPGTPGAQVMEAILSAVRRTCGVSGTDAEAGPVDELRAAVGDPRPGTIAYAVRRLASAAQGVRDQLSYDTWHVLARLERTLTSTPELDAQLQPQLYDILESTLAMAGVFGENMMRDTTWAFIEAGTRIERAQLLVSLVRTTLCVDRPPAIDGQVAEAVLNVGESIITHRRRLVSGEGPARPVQSALVLLLLDSSNPRSMTFALDRLTEAVEQIGDKDLLGECDKITQTLGAMDLDACTDGDRHVLTELLAEVESGLRSVSQQLAERHFRRRAPQHSLLNDWVASVQQQAQAQDSHLGTAR